MGEKITDESLKITEPYMVDDSVYDISYISVDPQTNINYNIVGSNIILTLNPSNNWVLPSKSYLYIEGQVLNADGTVFPIDAQGNPPRNLICK